MDDDGDDKRGERDEREDRDASEEPADVVILTGPTDDGEGVRVVRARENRLETGEVRPLKDGQPLVAGEVVTLAPRAGTRVCDVKVLAKIGASASTTKPAQIGPAQVATRAYRESWDRIFGEPTKREALLN